MPAPRRLLQLTDPHLGASWQAAEPAATLATVIDAVRALPQLPDAAIVTGDLTNHGADEEYAAVRMALERLGMPYHVIPGNHDDRAAMRRHFALPGEGAEPIQYAVELGPLRVLMLDTVIPGEIAGELDAARRGWLADALAAAPQTPTLLAMHHPPFLIGMPGMDGIAIERADREPLVELLSGHPQVVGIVAGHVHRAVAVAVAGRPAVTIPSTYCQSPLDFVSTDLEMFPEPLAFAVHELVDGRLVSHVQTLAQPAAG